MAHFRLLTTGVLTAGLAVFVSAPVSARQLDAQAPAPAQTGSAQGPLVVERVRDGFVIAPDVKITDVDGDAAALVGGYAGWLAQGTWLVGGGAYWMPDGPGGTELTYGGLVVGFVSEPTARIGFGVRALLGVGDGNVRANVSAPAQPNHPGRPAPFYGGEPHDPVRDSWVTREVRYGETFMVFEPQAEAVLRLTRNIGIAFGVGYRLTNASDYMDDRMHGVTGSFAVRFGGRP